MDSVLILLTVVTQVAAAGDFIPAEEVQLTLVVQRELAEKEAKDFAREETVEEDTQTMLLEDLEDLEGVVGLTEMAEVGREVVEVTLEEVAGTTKATPVGEGEDLTMLAKIKRMSVVSMRVGTVG